MLALASELVGTLADASTDVKATLVVSAVESVGAYVLPSRLAALRARWPGVRVEVLTGTCDEIRKASPPGRAISAWCWKASRADRRRRGRLDPGEGAAGGGRPPRAIHSPGGRLARPASPLRLLMSDAGGNYHRRLRQYFEAARGSAPRTQALGTIEGVKRGILAGGTALGCLPAHAVEPELRDGVLAEVRVRPALPGLVLRAVLAPGAVDSPLVDDLVWSLRGSPSGRDPPIPTEPPSVAKSGIPYRPAGDDAGPPDVVGPIRARRPGGKLLNLDRMLLQSPAFAQAWNTLFGTIRGKLAVPAKLREIAIMSIGVLNRADYEWFQHEGEFLKAGAPRNSWPR